MDSRLRDDRRRRPRRRRVVPLDDYADKYSELGGENEAFGKNFSEAFGDRAFSVAARQRALRSLGDGQKPFDAWATLQAAETLSLRMERHCENATAVARHLDDHHDVAWVRIPDWRVTRPTTRHAVPGRWVRRHGHVRARSRLHAGRRFCEETDARSFLANVGDAKTLVIHPASTTHAQLSEAEQRAAASGRTSSVHRRY